MTVALCQCGCGEHAPIAAMTNRKHGHVRGEPVRFVRGHAGRLRRRERLGPELWTPIDRGYESECWIWNGKPHKKTGYCRVKFGGRVMLAHRAMYEQEVGPIPAGLDVDHLCSQRDCVRPEHLEAATRAENIRRSRAAKLTQADVAVIRASTLSDRKVAALCGVSHQAVSDIRRGVTWRG